jgi:hypothetical protein
LAAQQGTRAARFEQPYYRHVHISKPILYAACAVFLVLVSLVSFLIGRETRRRDPAPVAATATPAVDPQAPQAPPSTMTTMSPTTPPAPRPVDPYAPPTPSPVDPYPPRTTAPAAPAPAQVAPSQPPPAPTANRADAIRAYFISVAAIQTYAATGDSTQLAQQLLASAAGGDSSGFDRLVDGARQGIEKARALTPPPECAAYHGKLLALLGDGVSLMTQLKSAIARSDTGALTSIAGNGTALQSRAEALAAEEKSIKSSAGVF